MNNFQKNLRFFTAILFLLGSAAILATPSSESSKAVVVIRETGNPSTIGKITRYVLVGGVVVAATDYYFFGGRLILQPTGRWLFPSLFERFDRIDLCLKELDEKTAHIETGVGNLQEAVGEVKTDVANANDNINNMQKTVTKVETQVGENGNGIAFLRKTASEHTNLFTQVTAQLAAANQGITNNGQAIAKTQEEISSVKTTVENNGQKLEQLGKGQEETLAIVRKLENALNGNGSTMFAQAVKNWQTIAPPALATITGQIPGTPNNVHGFTKNQK